MFAVVPLHHCTTHRGQLKFNEPHHRCSNCQLQWASGKLPKWLNKSAGQRRLIGRSVSHMWVYKEIGANHLWNYVGGLLNFIHS